MGFIGYRFIGDRRLGDRVRMFLECSDRENGVSSTYPVDVVFSAKADVRIEGVTDVFALKKFYKLVNSLEERAREHGRERQVIFRTPEDLLDHLRLTRNSRELTEDPPSRLPVAKRPFEGQTALE
jgi:hypothetical protein